MPDLHETINQFLEGSISTIGRQPVIESKNITENGTYTAPSGVDGYSPVVVNVPIPEPVIESKNITENGTYTAPSGVDGYSPVVVNVPTVEPVIESKTITANGTYTAPSGVDGYSPVVVNVPTVEPVIESKTITANGTYTAPSGVDGYSPVIVNVSTPAPPAGLYNKTFVEGDMTLLYGLYGYYNSIWSERSTNIGCTIQGTVDIGQYNNIHVTGTITKSYAKTQNSNLARVQFVVGTTDEIFNSIILVDYNTGNHINSRETVTLYDKESQTVSVDVNVDISEISAGYLFVSLLGISMDNIYIELS